MANDLLPLSVLLGRLTIGWIFVWAGFEGGTDGGPVRTGVLRWANG